MFRHAPRITASDDAVAAAADIAPTTPCRVSGIIVKEATFKKITRANLVALLWRVLDRCVVPAEQRADHLAHFGSSRDNDSIPAALVMIDVTFPPNPNKHPNDPILGPLTTEYPTLTRSLRALMIRYSDYDETATLGPFAALATRLEELTFWVSRIASMRGLEGRCEYLRKVDLHGCYNISSIDALSDHVYLEEVVAPATGITSLEPLRTCPALTKVDVSGCEALTSMEGLEDHQWLREVHVSDTAITSIEPLRTCPRLTVVALNDCDELSSIEALADHQWLKQFYASCSGIASIEPLRTCPALKRAELMYCDRLPADVRLPKCVKVVREW